MSVTVPGSNQMMRSQKTDGSAVSGGGVALAGFYVPNADVAARLKDLDVTHGPFSKIALHESAGWTFVVGLSGPVVSTGLTRISHLRRESHRFFEELPAWFFQTKATGLADVAISQDSAFLSITLLYAIEVQRV